jgi:nucleotide-binding universal stress UspA family protein
LIVLGTHQRSGFDRLRLGSVAEAVTLRATQPVLIVPASAGGRTAESAMSFDNIMVAVDFSAGSIAAIETALWMAPANSRVTLVHVVSSIPLANAYRYSYQLDELAYQRLLARNAWRKLQDIALANAKTSRRVYARVVAGDPSIQLARIATEVDAQVILVGVTRRGAIGRRIFRSTAARAIRTSARPVMAIPELVEQGAIPGFEENQLATAA